MLKDNFWEEREQVWNKKRLIVGKPKKTRIFGSKSLTKCFVLLSENLSKEKATESVAGIKDVWYEACFVTTGKLGILWFRWEDDIMGL